MPWRLPCFLSLPQPALCRCWAPRALLVYLAAPPALCLVLEPMMVFLHTPRQTVRTKALERHQILIKQSLAFKSFLKVLKYQLGYLLDGMHTESDTI